MLDVTNPLFILARALPPSLYPHKRNKLCILSQVNWFSLWFGVPKQTHSDWKCWLRRAGNLMYVIRLEKHELAGLSFKVITELGGHAIQSCQLEHVKPGSMFFKEHFSNWQLKPTSLYEGNKGSFCLNVPYCFSYHYLKSVIFASMYLHLYIHHLL